MGTCLQDEEGLGFLLVPGFDDESPLGPLRLVTSQRWHPGAGAFSGARGRSLYHISLVATVGNSPLMNLTAAGHHCLVLVTEHTHPSLLPKAKNTKSVLDVDPTAQALLEVSGRTRHSEGLREVPEDQ